MEEGGFSSEQPCSTLAAHRNHRENFKNYRWWLCPRSSGLIGLRGQRWGLFSNLSGNSQVHLQSRNSVFGRSLCAQIEPIYSTERILYIGLKPNALHSTVWRFPWQTSCSGTALFSLSIQGLSEPQGFFPANIRMLVWCGSF